MEKKINYCQSCGMPLTNDVLGTNADGSKNERLRVGERSSGMEYCMYCYKDGKFLQDCTMEEMIEHCAQFVGAVNEGLPNPITKEEYIGQMKMYFPQLKRWRKALTINNDEDLKVNPALAGVKELIAQMADSLPPKIHRRHLLRLRSLHLRLPNQSRLLRLLLQRAFPARLSHRHRR